MSIAERKGRQRAEREQRIIAAARLIAEGAGWSAVTIRRLAEEIEYSQPVLYSHFENRDAIVAAVAIEGFRQFTTALRQAAREATDRRSGLECVAMAYLGFAMQNPALYEAMFTLPTGLRFAELETRSELKDAFRALAAVVEPSKTDVAVATETFWAALHGLVELERSGRIRRGARDERVAFVVDGLLGC
nr:TetR/AcrR family transcriptional regulator [uncultured Lichenicoccus sp.]